MEEIKNVPDYLEVLRDEFAAKAMGAILNADSEILDTTESLANQIARESYVVADAMMKARQDKFS